MSIYPTYPFAAIVGQETMKLALILNVIEPSLSGVLIRGEKGTGKSTAVRALADILPEIEVIENCPFQLGPGDGTAVCLNCPSTACRDQVLQGITPPTRRKKISVVELPVGATEDRVVGSMDLEHALHQGEKQIEPGLLAAAHRGILYVDEVNLLDDHVVDVLLDTAAMGMVSIEREGISFVHPSRFTLVGTMNPEEGELRPQLLDRFGLCVYIEGIHDLGQRVQVMQRRFEFEQDALLFGQSWEEESQKLMQRIDKAVGMYPRIQISDERLYDIAAYCLDVGVDGHRGDIIILKAAKALAAYHGRKNVQPEDIQAAAELALPHRIRRQPLQDMVMNVEGLRRERQTTHE